MREISGTNFRNQWAELTEPVTVKRYTKVIGEWFPSGTRTENPEPDPEPKPVTSKPRASRKTAATKPDLSDIPESERGWFTKKMGIDKNK